MKYYFFTVITLLFLACNNSATKKADAATVPVVEEKPSFFPVTDYLKGQIYEIAEKGKFPVKYTTINEKTDSVTLKFDGLNELFKDFLHPLIDSSNLIPLFKETKFLDQTIAAFTFSYDPKTTLPDSMLLKRWDVYIDAESNKVKRVYMVKKDKDNKTLQLLWESDKWCKITTINNAGDSSKVEKEEKISWSY